MKNGEKVSQVILLVSLSIYLFFLILLGLRAIVWINVPVVLVLIATFVKNANLERVAVMLAANSPILCDIVLALLIGLFAVNSKVAMHVVVMAFESDIFQTNRVTQEVKKGCYAVITWADAELDVFDTSFSGVQSIVLFDSFHGVLEREIILAGIFGVAVASKVLELQSTKAVARMVSKV